MYDELVKRLREEASGWCANCCYRCGDNVCGAPDDRKNDCDIASKLQAADAIEDLSKQFDNMNEANIALYGALPKWIPVNERLPDVPGTYLVLMKEPKKWTERRVKGEAEEWENFDFSHVEPAFYNKDQGIWDDDDTPMNANLDVVNTYEAFHVTHWMPLPEPPKEG